MTFSKMAQSTKDLCVILSINDTQHNATQHGTQHNDTQHKGLLCDTQQINDTQYNNTQQRKGITCEINETQNMRQLA